MELFVNILTLTACFATMAYCYILAKRIHAFHNIKDGVGALIEEMIRTTSDLQIAFTTTQRNIDTQYNKIQDKIDEGVALTEYLNTILQEVEDASSILERLKDDIALNQPTQRKHDSVATHYHNYNHNTQNIKHSTLPDSFRLPNHIERPASVAPQDDTQSEDPLEDVVPADFNALKRKKRPKIIFPGEAYL